MTLENNYVLGTMFPIDLDSILNKSNAVWGCKNVGRIRGQLAFSLFTYLGSMHIDKHAPECLTESVVQLLTQLGIPTYVKATSQLFDYCVRQGTFNYDWNSLSFDDRTELGRILPGVPSWISFISWFGNWDATPMEKAWALRFLKRFTVDGAIKVRTECLSKFILTNDRNKILDRNEYKSYQWYILSIAKKYLSWLLSDFSLENVVAELEGWEFYPTPNAVHDCCADPRHRILYVLGSNSFTCDLQYPSLEGWERYKLTDETNVIVSAVAKDCKSYRIVSPDTPLHLAWQQAIVHELERCINQRGMTTNLPIHDQEVMRNLVYETTQKLINYATLDLSSASDTVRLSLVRELFPNHVTSLLDYSRPLTFSVKGKTKKRTLYMFAPMGCAYTLLMQSLVFWALDSAICQFCCRLDPSLYVYMGSYTNFIAGGEVYTIFPFACYAMGDDQQVPVAFAETVIELLGTFGFIVNQSKSFFDEEAMFRESCGAEALNGMPVDGYYIPRHALSISCKGSTIHNLSDLAIDMTEGFSRDRDRSGNVIHQTTLTAVITMSKTLWLLGHQKMAQLLSQWVATQVPEMTVSEIGTPASDLWGLQDIVHLYKALPMAQKMVKEELIPVHDSRVRRIRKDNEWIMKRVELPKILYTKTVTTIKWKHTLGREIPQLRPMHWAVTSERKRLASLSNPTKEGTCPVCKYLSSHTDRVVLAEAILQRYQYNRWLMNGPYYQSELDRLLKVSSPTPRIDVKVDPKYGVLY